MVKERVIHQCEICPAEFQLKEHAITHEESHMIDTRTEEVKRQMRQIIEKLESRSVEDLTYPPENFTYERLGRRLQKARRETDLTQTEVGKAIGKSHGAISNYELGKTSIEVIDLIKLSALYQKPLSFFFKPETESK